MAKKDELNFENGSNLASGEKLKALQAAMDKIEKSFGKGSIMKMGDESVEQVEVIPTGSIGLNVALGVGGYPRGRIIEIYGPESSGKTTLAIHAIAEAQKAGGIAAFIDAEHAFDRFYAAKLGVDVDNLLISQPDNGEQALEIAEQLIRSSAIDIIVVDSVAALTPKAEIEGDMGDNKVGLQARLMSQALRKLTAAVSKTRTTCIFINQLREKIGVMFGNPETTTGGNALKFYASVRLDIRGSQAIKNGDEVIGKQTKVKVVKNKVAPPFRRAEFDIMFGEGISRAGEIIDLGAELGIIKKSGSWFSYNETKIAQGRDAAKQVILDNPEFDVEKFGCQWAYTMDGGDLGELEFENFNAAGAKVSIKGVSVHTGYAKGKMINANRLACEFNSLIPETDIPETTEGYQGFYHLISMETRTEEAKMSYIIRDHDREKFEERKQFFLDIANKMNAKYGEGTVSVKLNDQYYNMKEKIDDNMHVIDIVLRAMQETGVRPKVEPIRGGTDGAQLSFKGLPCPNIFAGGVNFHGPYEFVSIQVMQKAVDVIVKICEITGTYND